MQLDEGLTFKCPIGYDSKCSPFFDDLVGLRFNFSEKFIAQFDGREMIHGTSIGEKEGDEPVDDQGQDRLVSQNFF